MGVEPAPAFEQSAGMCGRFASCLQPDTVRALFRTFNAVLHVLPSWNAAPTQPAMAVRLKPETNGRHLDLLQWDLISHLTKNVKSLHTPINARRRPPPAWARSAAHWSAAAA